MLASYMYCRRPARASRKGPTQCSGPIVRASRVVTCYAMAVKAGSTEASPFLQLVSLVPSPRLFLFFLCFVVMNLIDDLIIFSHHTQRLPPLHPPKHRLHRPLPRQVSRACSTTALSFNPATFSGVACCVEISALAGTIAHELSRQPCVSEGTLSHCRKALGVSLRAPQSRHADAAVTACDVAAPPPASTSEAALPDTTSPNTSTTPPSTAPPMGAPDASALDAPAAPEFSSCGDSIESRLEGMSCSREMGGGYTLHWSDAVAARQDPAGTISLVMEVGCPVPAPLHATRRVSSKHACEHLLSKCHPFEGERKHLVPRTVVVMTLMARQDILSERYSP